MNKLQQISKYFNKLSEACGSNPQEPPMNRPPQMMAPPMNRPSIPPQNFQPNPQLSPNQLEDPDFIANIITQVLQQLSNSEEDFLNEQAVAPEETKVKVNILGDEKEVTIKTTPGKDLDDVTISWNEPYGEEIHNLDFEAGDVMDDHGNEGKDMIFTASASFGPKSSLTWEFSLEVYVEASYEMSGNIGDWDWNTLEIEKGKNSDWPGEDEAGMAPRVDMDEGSCGYTQTADGKKLKTPGGTKGVSGLNRTNFMRNQQN